MDMLAVGGTVNVSVDVFNGGDPSSTKATPSIWKVGNKVVDVTANIFNFSNDIGKVKRNGDGFEVWLFPRLIIIISIDFINGFEYFHLISLPLVDGLFFFIITPFR